MNAIAIGVIVLVLIIMVGITYATRKVSQVHNTIGDLTMDVEHENLRSLIGDNTDRR